MFRDLADIDLLVIHCSDTPDGEPYTIWDIDAWHRLRGFQRSHSATAAHQPSLLHCGYHKVYSVGGATWDGRSLEEVGAHVKGYNRSSIGVCMIGRTRFSVEQWHSLRLDVEQLLRRWPGLRIVGHRALAPHKTCPGFDVSRWLAGGMQPLAEHLLNRDNRS